MISNTFKFETGNRIRSNPVLSELIRSFELQCPLQRSLTLKWDVCRCPGVSLTLCCFVVYSTRQFVLCLTLCYFVLVFFSPFSFAITSLGEERANLSASTIALKAYSSYTPGPFDLILGRKHRGDL